MFCLSTALVVTLWAVTARVDGESPLLPKHLASTSSNAPFGRIGPIGGLNLEDKLASIFQKVANAQTPRDSSTTLRPGAGGLQPAVPSTPPRLLRLPTAKPPPHHDGFDLLAGSITRRPVIFKFPVTSPPTTTTTTEPTTTVSVTVPTTTTPFTTQSSTTTQSVINPKK
jgi:hypothetical protein